MSTSSIQKSVRKRITQLSSVKRNGGKALFTYYHRRILLELSKFIDDPFCNKKAFTRLYFCQSELKPLQERQRETLVKVVTALFSYMDVETLRVGVATPNYLVTVSHDKVLERYEECWGETLDRSKYFRAINQLKLAGYFTVEAVYTNDPARIAMVTPDKPAPQVMSVAAYKSFTDLFLDAFSFILGDEGVVKSKKQGIAKRIATGLHNAWVMFVPTSSSYFYKRKKLLASGNYPQSSFS